MAQLLGRDSVVERIAAAVDRARVAGGGTVVVCGPGGVGTSAVVEEALRPFGTKVSRGRGAVPPDAEAAVWWIGDAQRMPPADAERLGSPRWPLLATLRAELHNPACGPYPTDNCHVALPVGTIVAVNPDAFGGAGGVIAVEPGNGQQTTLSRGGLFVEPFSVAFLADGRLVVSDI